MALIICVIHVVNPLRSLVAKAHGWQVLLLLLIYLVQAWVNMIEYLRTVFRTLVHDYSLVVAAKVVGLLLHGTMIATWSCFVRHSDYLSVHIALHGSVDVFCGQNTPRCRSFCCTCALTKRPNIRNTSLTFFCCFLNSCCQHLVIVHYLCTCLTQLLLRASGHKVLLGSCSSDVADVQVVVPWLVCMVCKPCLIDVVSSSEHSFANIEIIELIIRNSNFLKF
jgi:hypothetical protein